MSNSNRIIATPLGKIKRLTGHGVSVRYQLKEFAEETLGRDSLKKMVLLPEGEDVREWIACHILDFYNHATLLYSSVSELCIKDTCPRMTAGPRYEYLWSDGDVYKKATSMPAKQYISLLFKRINTVLDDENAFPRADDGTFSTDFLTDTAPKIVKMITRVYAHIYHHHYPDLTRIGLQTMLNTSFHHFALFATRFRLVELRELGPLRDVIKALV